MKKYFILILLTLMITEIANAQTIQNSQKNKKRNSEYMTNTTPRDLDNYYYNRHYWNREYSRNASVEILKNKIEIMKEDVKNHYQYSDRKKEALLRELDFSLKKINDADINKDGILDRTEQESYRDERYIEHR